MGKKVTASLNVRVGATTGQFTSGMTRAGATTKTFTAKIDKAKVALKAFAGTAIIGAVIVGLGKMKASIIDTFTELDRVGKRTAKLGLTVKTFRALELGASRFGVSVDSIADAMKDLSIRIGEASLGTGGAAPFFEQLGFGRQAQAISSFPARERLLLVVDAINKIESSTKRSAFFNALLGESGVRLSKFFEGGSRSIVELEKDVVSLGLAIDGSAIAKIEDMNDAWGDSKLAVTALAEAIGLKLAPKLKVLADLTTGAIAPKTKQGSFAKLTAATLADLFASTPKSREALATAREDLIASRGGAAVGRPTKPAGTVAEGLPVIEPIPIERKPTNPGVIRDIFSQVLPQFASGLRALGGGDIGGAFAGLGRGIGRGGRAAAAGPGGRAANELQGFQNLFQAGGRFLGGIGGKPKEEDIFEGEFGLAGAALGGTQAGASALVQATRPSMTLDMDRNKKLDKQITLLELINAGIQGGKAIAKQVGF